MTSSVYSKYAQYSSHARSYFSYTHKHTRCVLSGTTPPPSSVVKSLKIDNKNIKKKYLFRRSFNPKQRRRQTHNRSRTHRTNTFPLQCDCVAKLCSNETAIQELWDYVRIMRQCEFFCLYLAIGGNWGGGLELRYC